MKSSDFVELVAELTTITKKQAVIIDELFRLLVQYTTMEELEPIINSMKDVAEKKNKIDEQ